MPFASLASPSKMVGKCRANVSSPGKMVGECRANVTSPANFPKWTFWRVLEFDKTGKFLASTQIRQIRRRVAIAYFKYKINCNFFLVDQNWKLWRTKKGPRTGLWETLNQYMMIFIPAECSSVLNIQSPRSGVKG